ncbi:ankyrin repeat-containing domain protein [Triangularia setosa]|uniref:Ankyrin repeat-containing domain protein n=1 Tax=Triangularia setosa TaxID=2587417 RepID=A0AAN7A0I5_9PEZI|nr:ankyrin repeat-containing domain protein [Podospora setosa]
MVESGKTDVDIKDHDGYTSLAWAVTRGRLAVVRYLVHTGRVNVEPRDGHGRTPLAVAAMNNTLEVVEYLANEVKGDVETRDSLGRNTLCRETQLAKTAEEIIDVVTAMLSAGCDPTVRDQEGRSALSLIQRIQEVERKERLRASWHKILRLYEDSIGLPAYL